MKVTWEMVGQKERPVQETQNSYLSMTTSSWGKGAPQVPLLPQGPQPTPYILTGSANGSR